MYRLPNRSVGWYFFLVLMGWHDCAFVTAWSQLNMGIGSSPSPMLLGSAATPYNKQKIIVIGSGGYLGGMTFGYLQRASSLYGTGIGPIRCIGATADTSVRLNRILGKQFHLAHADESFIKLTNLLSVDAIYNRMIGYDAILLSPNLYVEQKIVTANTYEKTPNDIAWEIYWDLPKGSYSDFHQSNEAIKVRDMIFNNFINAAQKAKLKHIFLVVTDNSSSSDESTFTNALSLVKASGIPFTFIQTPQLTDRSSTGYTFQDGLCNDMIVEAVDESMIVGKYIESGESTATMCREDVAALCVQVMQSCDWNQPQPRFLKVTTNGPLLLVPPTLSGTPKRIDQQWCINSYILESKLQPIK